MTDEDHRAEDPSKACLHGGDVGREGIEAVLTGHHVMALGLESVGINLLKHDPSAQRPCAKTMLGLITIVSIGRVNFGRVHVA